MNVLHIMRSLLGLVYVISRAILLYLREQHVCIREHTHALLTMEIDLFRYFLAIIFRKQLGPARGPLPHLLRLVGVLCRRESLHALKVRIKMSFWIFPRNNKKD